MVSFAPAAGNSRSILQVWTQIWRGAMTAQSPIHPPRHDLPPGVPNTWPGSWGLMVKSPHSMQGLFLVPSLECCPCPSSTISPGRPSTLLHPGKASALPRWEGPGPEGTPLHTHPALSWLLFVPQPVGLGGSPTWALSTDLGRPLSPAQRAQSLRHTHHRAVVTGQVGSTTRRARL